MTHILSQHWYWLCGVAFMMAALLKTYDPEPYRKNYTNALIATVLFAALCVVAWPVLLFYIVFSKLLG
jgi:hypothetical protein